MQIPQDLIETATLKLKSVQSEAEFFQLRSQYLGKKSFIIRCRHGVSEHSDSTILFNTYSLLFISIYFNVKVNSYSWFS